MRKRLIRNSSSELARLMMLLALLALLSGPTHPAVALADQGPLRGGDVTSAQNSSANFQAVLYKNGHLVFQARADETASSNVSAVFEGNVDGYGSAAQVPWHKAADSILWVSFDGIFKEVLPKSLKCWFAGCKNLTSIDLANLDASQSTTMETWFTCGKADRR